MVFACSHIWRQFFSLISWVPKKIDLMNNLVKSKCNKEVPCLLLTNFGVAQEIFYFILFPIGKNFLLMNNLGIKKLLCFPESQIGVQFSFSNEASIYKSLYDAYEWQALCKKNRWRRLYLLFTPKNLDWYGKLSMNYPL